MTVTDETEAKGNSATASGAEPGRQPVSGTEWLAQFSELLGISAPSQEDVDALLGLAGIAAHASERTAAPLSTWLVGRAGVAPTDAKALAARLADELKAES